MRRWLLTDNLRLRLALRRERRLTHRLTQQLEGERDRNRTREDALNTAYLQMMGLFGLPPRTGPASPRPTFAQQVEEVHRQQTAPALPYNTDPFDLLTPFEQAEFAEVIWRSDGQGEAQLAGATLQDARHRFAKQILESRVSNRFSM